MNRTIRILSIVMLVILVICAFTIPALAIDPTKITIEDQSDSGVASLFGNIIGIVQVIGTGIAIIMLIVLAMKYLMAAPSEKADIKKGALIYVIAAILLFAAVNVLAIIRDWSQDATNGIATNSTASISTYHIVG